MSVNKTEWIWFNGEWKRWDEATVHVSAHALQYGSTAFEGIRAYETRPRNTNSSPTGSSTAIFRLAPHIQRLFRTCKILRMNLGEITEERLSEVCVDLVARNRLRSCYLRPLIFRGSGTLGVNPLAAPVDMAIFAIEWGRYLGSEAIEQGVDVAVSSWRRFNASVAAPLGKIGGQYVTSQFVSIEATGNGFAEGLMLDESGMVCEGAGENIFVVLDGELITPPLSASILGGITRDTLITLAQDLGIPLRFEAISRDMLYIADEMFMTGTAAEVSPVRSVDRVPIGNGSRGPITERLQREFFGIIEGEIDDRHGWLTPVPQLESVAVANS